MITKRNIYSLLILLTLVSFGFFGSLSHIFCFTLIIISFLTYIRSKRKNAISNRSQILFCLLSGCFFLLFLGSLFRSNLSEVTYSISPMFPIPIIGSLIILHFNTGFRIHSKQISQFSQISVLFALSTYLTLTILPDPNGYYQKFYANRLMLFSGNPIPFSFAMLGISIFCLADWKNSEFKSKVIALACFFIGAFFAGILSGTRGTLLSLLIIIPFIVYYLSGRPVITVILTAALGSFGIIFIYFISLGKFETEYMKHIQNGFETIITGNNNESSVWQRLEMWSAAIKAISEAPVIGYSIVDRFNAIKPFLINSIPSYTHPHNDIFATTISIGFTGAIAAMISLTSIFLASLLTPKWSSDKVLFSLIMLIPILITASVSTVFFNDITSAWLAFSTYLIWATDFKKFEHK